MAELSDEESSIEELGEDVEVIEDHKPNPEVDKEIEEFEKDRKVPEIKIFPKTRSDRRDKVFGKTLQQDYEKTGGHGHNWAPGRKVGRPKSSSASIQEKSDIPNNSKEDIKPAEKLKSEPMPEKSSEDDQVRIMFVKELPTIQTRTADIEGKKVSLITHDEALVNHEDRISALEMAVFELQSMLKDKKEEDNGETKEGNK